MHLFDRKSFILIWISLKFVPNHPINKMPTLDQIMAWQQTGDRALREAVLVLVIQFQSCAPVGSSSGNWRQLFLLMSSFVLNSMKQQCWICMCTKLVIPCELAEKIMEIIVLLMSLWRSELIETQWFIFTKIYLSIIGSDNGWLPVWY